MATQTKFYIPFINLNEDLITYTPNNWNSLFIPSLPSVFIDEDLLIYVIEEIFYIGEVKRVDIVKKENSDNRLMAFIHMNYWYKNNSVDTFRLKIQSEGHVDVYGFINNSNLEIKYCDFISNLKDGLFIRFMINKTPIKDTELNIHQIADLLEKADKKITEQDLLIEQLMIELEDTKKKLHEAQINPYNNNFNFINVSDDISDIVDLDDYLFQKENEKIENELENIERPVLVRECYI